MWDDPMKESIWDKEGKILFKILIIVTIYYVLY